MTRVSCVHDVIAPPALAHAASRGTACTSTRIAEPLPPGTIVSTVTGGCRSVGYDPDQSPLSDMVVTTPCVSDMPLPPIVSAEGWFVFSQSSTWLGDMAGTDAHSHRSEIGLHSSLDHGLSRAASGDVASACAPGGSSMVFSSKPAVSAAVRGALAADGSLATWGVLPAQPLSVNAVVSAAQIAHPVRVSRIVAG